MVKYFFVIFDLSIKRNPNRSVHKHVLLRYKNVYFLSLKLSNIVTADFFMIQKSLIERADKNLSVFWSDENPIQFVWKLFDEPEYFMDTVSCTKLEASLVTVVWFR